MMSRTTSPVPDFEGDEYAEIAAVITPHIGGIPKAYRRTGVDTSE